MATVEMTLGNGLTIMVEGPRVHVEDTIYDRFTVNGILVTVRRTPSGTPPSAPTPANLPEAGPVAFGTPPAKSANRLRLRWLATTVGYFAFALPLIGFGTASGGVRGGIAGAVVGACAIFLSNAVAELLERW